MGTQIELSPRDVNALIDALERALERGVIGRGEALRQDVERVLYRLRRL